MKQGQASGGISNYKPPQGPSNISEAKSPGLHGGNLGNCGTQGGYGPDGGESGSPGIKGTNHGNCGSQK